MFSLGMPPIGREYCPESDKEDRNLTIEDFYGHIPEGSQRHTVVQDDWLDDADYTFRPFSSSGKLLCPRHNDNVDRDDEVDLEELCESMESDGWIEGVSGVPWGVIDPSSDEEGASLMMGAGARFIAWYKSYKRNPNNPKLQRNLQNGAC